MGQYIKTWNGSEWIAVEPPKHEGSSVYVGPVAPEQMKDGDIFVSTVDFSSVDILSVNRNVTLSIDGPEYIRCISHKDIDVTLFSPAQKGIVLRLKNRGMGTVNISGTIDGRDGFVLSPGDGCTLITNGVDWDLL